MLTDALEQRVASFLAGGPGTVSVFLGTASGTSVAQVAADAAHYAASTMKLPLVVAAYRLHQRGALDLDAPVPVHNAFASALDGSAFSLLQEDDQDDATWARLGDAVPLRTLARHAVVHSGNLATNLLLEHVGTPEVARVLADAGCSSTTVVSRGIGDAAAREAGLDNLVTAADLGRVMAGVSAEVEAVLADQQHRDGIPAGLPAGTYVANKTGWVDGVTHDVALVRPEGRDPYVLAVCTTVDVPEDDAHALIAALSRTVWEDWP